MGILFVQCTKCERSHTWWSGTTDALCSICTTEIKALRAVSEAVRGINREMTSCGRCMVIHDSLAALDKVRAKVETNGGQTSENKFGNDTRWG